MTGLVPSGTVTHLIRLHSSFQTNLTFRFQSVKIVLFYPDVAIFEVCFSLFLPSSLCPSLPLRLVTLLYSYMSNRSIPRINYVVLSFPKSK